jgi:hypothetical protein
MLKSNLISRVYSLQNCDPENPSGSTASIIFLSHGLGGSLVKQVWERHRINKKGCLLLTETTRCLCGPQNIANINPSLQGLKH